MSAISPPSGMKIPMIKPDHVSLGQCVVHQEFTRKYSSIKDIEIINLLHDGFLYNGFKDLLIDSTEQEGFANMHHILHLSSLDTLITKELCVQRANNIDVDLSKLKTDSQVLTDINSAVVITPYKGEALHFYFFTKDHNSCFKLDHSESFKALLMSDILTLEFSSHMLVVNFRSETPTTRQIDLNDDVSVLTTSLEMVVTYKSSDTLPQLHCEYLHDDTSKTVLVSTDLLSELIESKIITISMNKTYWICANDEKISVYTLDSQNSFSVNNCTAMNSFFPTADYLTFIDLCYCNTTKQCFLLYLKEEKEDISSFIVVFDVNKLQATSILEMEMTLNRTPDLGMYPLRDGSRLFVQEIFENRTIFYQSFTLLPVDHMLQSLSL